MGEPPAPETRVYGVRVIQPHSVDHARDQLHVDSALGPQDILHRLPFRQLVGQLIEVTNLPHCRLQPRSTSDSYFAANSAQAMRHNCTQMFPERIRSNSQAAAAQMIADTT